MNNQPDVPGITMCGATKGKAVCDFRAGHDGPHLDSAADVEWEKFAKQKYCCSVCAQKRRCHVCDDETGLSCSDCAIDLQATVYVCKKKECRDYHDTKCGQSLRSNNAALEARLETLTLYREWLRDGYRAIANGLLSEETQADNYKQFARDTLSGPTRAALDAIILARSQQAPATPEEK